MYTLQLRKPCIITYGSHYRVLGRYFSLKTFVNYCKPIFKHPYLDSFYIKR